MEIAPSHNAARHDVAVPVASGASVSKTPGKIICMDALKSLDGFDRIINLNPDHAAPLGKPHLTATAFQQGKHGKEG